MTATSDEQAVEAEGRRRRRRRYLTSFGFFLIALILLILIVLIAAKGCDGDTPPEVTVEVTRIVEVTVVHTVEVPGPTQLVTQLVTTTPCVTHYPWPEPPPTGLPLARSFQIALIVFVGLALLFVAYRLRGTVAE
jgi:hypothetical protein